MAAGPREETNLEAGTTLWGYAPLSEHAVPSSPAAEAAGWGARRLWKRLRGALSGGGRDSDRARIELDRLSSDRVERLMPSVEWSAAASALAAALAEWSEDARVPTPVRPVVGPPGSGVGAVLGLIAREREWPLVEAPRSADLLERSAALQGIFDALDDASDRPLVLCRLERMYLRHEVALDFVRELVEAIASGRRRILVGCESWAWSYLRRAIDVEGLLGRPWAARAFGAEQLDQWLGSPFRSQDLECRQAGSEQLVFAPAGEEARKSSRVLEQLAAAARGIPGVALELWRRSVRSWDHAEESGKYDPARTYWVAPDGALDAPQLPPGADRLHRLVLHCLLLHGGLDSRTLPALLPLSHDRVLRRVRELASAGIVEERDAELHVVLGAYPGARRELADDGLLTDDF